jgi:polyisoprenoid-binding protein YceI
MFRSSLTLAVALLGSVAASAADKFALDGSHTSIVFAVNHLGFSECYGSFEKAEGAMVVDGSNPAKSSFNFTIDASSIDTNDEKRDQHLKAADFFNVKEFPEITFKSSAIEVKDDVWHVTGEMTMHGETKEVTLPMTKMGEGKSPFGDYRIGYKLETTLKRSDFGMSGMVPAIGDEIHIMISFEGVKE